MRTAINIFIYGTLLDEDVSAMVIMETFSVIPANLPDYRALYVKGHIYPGIRAEIGTETSGGVIRGLSAKAISRLEYFEGENYSLKPINVLVRGKTEGAYFFVPGPKIVLSDNTWELNDWMRRHKSAYLDKYF